ncbi:hypothetical protein AAFF_G00370290 [Aldrovandia affinis]|uniref:Uncharacterized protein n=1 Tax=Aldrovandia affinis TaxID=143900 RepID=A0AAD7WN49_9TELE|nr:hypothetical protein AAFF_G00370290 [Aldrovandia affinis]
MSLVCLSPSLYFHLRWLLFHQSPSLAAFNEDTSTCSSAQFVSDRQRNRTPHSRSIKVRPTYAGIATRDGCSP